MSTNITEATLKNFQKVYFAKIEPSGNLIVLAGKNGAGKTSTNDGLEAAKEAKAVAIAENKQPLLTKEWEQVQAMHQAVMDHPVAGKLFTGHIPERSFFWEEDGMKFKCRPDALHEDMIVDLKTTVNASPDDFGKTAFDFGYFVSAALYQKGVEKITGKKLPFIFVNVEKNAPYIVSVVELDSDAFDMGHQMIERGVRIYIEGMEILQAIAEATDFQIFIELVKEDKGDEEYFFAEGELI